MLQGKKLVQNAVQNGFGFVALLLIFVANVDSSMSVDVK